MTYEPASRRAALAAAREVTERYPDSPRGWMLRARLEGTEPSGFTIVRAWLARWRRLTALDDALQAQRHPSATEMLALAQFAESLDEQETADKRYARALTDSTTEDPQVIAFRLGRLPRRDGMTPDRVVLEYEEIATQRPALAPLVRFYAIQAAVAARDSSAFVRLLNACVECRPVIGGWAVHDIPPLRHAIIPLLRAGHAQDRPLRDAERLLGYTRAERVSARAAGVAQRHAGLAPLLTLDGRPREALVEFETADRLGRAARMSPYAMSNVYSIQRLHAYLAIGDTANAIRTWARTAAMWQSGMHQHEMLAALGDGVTTDRRAAALAEARPIIEAERAAALPGPAWRRGPPLPLTYRNMFRSQ
jgi:hypothetical protein